MVDDTPPEVPALSSESDQQTLSVAVGLENYAPSSAHNKMDSRTDMEHPKFGQTVSQASFELLSSAVEMHLRHTHFIQRHLRQETLRAHSPVSKKYVRLKH